MSEPMSINVLVTGAAFDSEAGLRAWRFCRTALSAGLRVTQVFFYESAVHQSSRLAEPLGDEFNAADAWAQLAAEHDLELVVCVSAAEKRGLLNDEMAAQLGKEGSNIAAPFAVEGLASFHSASLTSNRTVTIR